MRIIVGIAFDFFCYVFYKTNEWATPLRMHPLIIIYTHVREGGKGARCQKPDYGGLFLRPSVNISLRFFDERHGTAESES